LRHQAIHWAFDLVALPNRSEVWAFDATLVGRNYRRSGQGLCPTAVDRRARTTVVTFHGASRWRPWRDVAIVDGIGLAFRTLPHDLVANDRRATDILLHDIRDPVTEGLHGLFVFVVQGEPLALFLIRDVLVPVLRGGCLRQGTNILIQRRRQGGDLSIEVFLQRLPGGVVLVHLFLQLVNLVLVTAPLQRQCVVKQPAIGDGPTLHVAKLFTLTLGHWRLGLGRRGLNTLFGLQQLHGLALHASQCIVKEIARAFHEQLVELGLHRFVAEAKGRVAPTGATDL
jgi:hypothetical protein